MKCIDCKYCIEEDYGYSNYTVEGTEVGCLLYCNPDFPEDRFYGEEPALLFANKCEYFEPGKPVHIDVDHEDGPCENYSDDPVIKLLLTAWGNNAV
jgi:hypothetical protein